MPILTEQEANAQTPLLPPTVAPKPAAPASGPVPDDRETMGAAFAQSNIIGSVLQKQAFGGYRNFEEKPNYNPYDNNGQDIKGYEEHADKFVKSVSPEQTQNIKDLIDAKNTDEDVLSRAGMNGHAASLAAGALDPLTLTMMLVPGLEEVGVGRLAKVGLTVGANVAFGEAQAAAIAATKPTGDYSEGIIPRIGVNALLAGVLGGVATRVPKDEFDAAAVAADQHVNGPPVPTESTAGAAQVAGTTLQQESIAKGGNFLARTLGRISPVTRIMSSSPEVESRRLAQQLVDFAPTLNKNKEGIATASSVEMEVNQQTNMRHFQQIQEFDRQYLAHKQGGGELSRNEFSHEVAVAMNHEDQHELPEVAAVARWARPMFNLDRAALQKVGALPEEFELLGDKSYFPRVWDQHTVATRQTELENILREHYTNNPLVREAPEPKVEEPKATGEPEKPKPSVEHVPEEETGNHTFKTTNGQLHAQEGQNGYLLTRRNDTLKTAQKNGEGTARLVAADKEATARGLKFGSDISMSRAAMNTWERFARETGAKLKINPHEINPETGNLVSLDPRVPVVEKLPDEPRRSAPVHQEPAEVAAAVRDTIDHITGMVRGTADVGNGLTRPGPLKARRLDLPFDKIKDFLSTDFEHVLSSYNHTVLPQIKMREKFGSVDLADQFQSIGDQYRIKIARAGDNDARKQELYKRQSEDINDLTLLRDRVLGQVGPRGDMSRNVVRAAQLLRSFNYLRMLGGQTLSALPDLGRLVTRYGLLNTVGRTSQLLSGFSKGLMKADAQKMATALDVVLHTRQTTLEGIGNELSGSDKLSRFARNQTNFFTKVSGIASWDAMMRTLSSQLEQDALHTLITKDNVSMLERSKLAAHGIGDTEVGAIREQWLKHGTNEMGLNRARTELWDNQDAARNVEQAVQRAGSSNAFFVGKGDLPGFANSQLGKMIVQFKAFAISSVNRLAIPLAQGLAHGDVHAANGLASMLALGALTYYTKEVAAGRKPDLSPDNLIPEMVQKSGILTYLPDLYDPAAGALHLPRFSKFQDLNPIETLGGASFGTAANLMDVIRRVSKGNISQSDLHKLRQLVPYNNIFYFNRLINMVEGKIGDAAGLKNSPNKSAIDYVNPTQDASPKEHPDKHHLLGVEKIPNAF